MKEKMTLNFSPVDNTKKGDPIAGTGKYTLIFNIFFPNSTAANTSALSGSSVIDHILASTITLGGNAVSTNIPSVCGSIKFRKVIHKFFSF